MNWLAETPIRPRLNAVQERGQQSWPLSFAGRFKNRNPHSAEEITQAVVVMLAKKSPQLAKEVLLSGWLYETARVSAVTFIRSEVRRTRREQEAHMETLLNETESDVWPQIARRTF